MFISRNIITEHRENQYIEEVRYPDFHFERGCLTGVLNSLLLGVEKTDIDRPLSVLARLSTLECLKYMYRSQGSMSTYVLREP